MSGSVSVVSCGGVTTCLRTDQAKRLPVRAAQHKLLQRRHAEAEPTDPREQPFHLRHSDHHTKGLGHTQHARRSQTFETAAPSEVESLSDSNDEPQRGRPSRQSINNKKSFIKLHESAWRIEGGGGTFKALKGATQRSRPGPGKLIENERARITQEALTLTLPKKGSYGQPGHASTTTCLGLQC
jgi:hypothetical protein